MERHRYLNFSGESRVLIVGDIHGEYVKLKEELDRLRFDPNHDVLISVGDLCDRGPYSYLYSNWIGQPFFYRVLGNHDIMPRMYLKGTAQRSDIKNWGGKWFVDLDHQTIEGIATDLEDAPLALTVKTPGGFTVGVVHGDSLQDWNTLIHLAQHDLTDWIETFCLWSKETINNTRYDIKHTGSPDHDTVYVNNIDHVFHGHTPLPEVTTYGNRTWIDTGACLDGGVLTVLDIDQFLLAKRSNLI